jgi:protein O-mannosyl-transferase
MGFVRKENLFLSASQAIAKRRRQWALGILLVGLVVIMYYPIIHAGYIWDDDQYVSENANLRDWQGLKRIWLVPSSSPQYYPLVFTGFWLERHICGPSPQNNHFINVIIHIANALLLWLLLQKLDVKPAFFVSLVFALHPVHLESVAWITERKNTLAGFFFLSGLLAYRYWFRLWVHSPSKSPPPHPSNIYYVFSLVLFLCALLSKTVTAVLPALLLILLWWRCEKVAWKQIAPLLPMFLLGGIFGIITAWIEVYHVGALGEEWTLSILERFLLAGRVIWFYVGKILWPHPLIFIYPRWEISSLSFWQYLFPLFTAALFSMLWRARARLGKEPLVVMAAFVCLLFPALGFFNVYPMRFSYVADHFQYLASIAIITGTITAINWMLGQTKLARARLFLACVVIVSLIGVGRAEIAKYQNEEMLWSDTVAKNQDCWLAHNNLGNLFIKQGRFQEARSEFSAVLRSKPNLAAAYNNMGIAYFREGSIAKALEQHRRAVELKPDYAEALNSLGVDYVNLQRIEEGIAAYRRALTVDPEYAMAHYNLANALGRLGKHGEAEKHYLEAIRIRSDMPWAHYYLGLSLLKQRRLADSSGYLETAFRLMPDYAEGYYQVGTVCLQQGKDEQALQYFVNAIKVKPNYAEAYCNMGSALMQQGSLEDAIRCYRKAIQLKPGYAIAQNNLGFALEKQGKVDEAIVHYSEALRLAPGNDQAKLNLEKAAKSRKHP